MILLAVSTRIPRAVTALAAQRMSTQANRGGMPTPSTVDFYDISLDAQLLAQRGGTDNLPRTSAWDLDKHLLLDNDEDEDDDEGWFPSWCDGETDVIMNDNEQELQRFRELRESLGSEVLQAELQAQIDLGADAFLQEHAQDATALEKLAMASVTSQLPQPALQALSSSADGRVTRRGRGNGGAAFLSSGGSGVSREEEIRLARLVQQGAALFKVREWLRVTLGRCPTRQEWAERAKMTTKELRRHVSNYRSAKHMLVEANMGLVHAVVNQQYHALRHGVSKTDLIQEGSLGLLRAAELFDPSRGLRFSTYAVVWIKGTLFNSHLSEFVRLPQREKTKYSKILKAERDIKAGEYSASSSSPERVAQATGLTVEDVLSTQERMGQAQRLMSLDYEYEAQSRSGAESSKKGFLEKDPSLQADVDLAERTQLQADVLAALARNLDAREARLMRLRYGLSDGHARTLHECAEAMGLSYTRVHQLANKCLEKLRKAAEVEALEEYLLTVA
jgi:RNA polymerase sigma factor (sigma-70 family)